ncbi:DUF2905 domain-containing protein [Bacillus sp. 165]|uniref:DUF2905 domain-containing protein n=1 Tax=Bacillus sp. 165 TaxID=1529117 RepID=UPI001ADA5B8D|nr:DUF2905 domain-containing protein [Bacillus sp. 165]MBO9130481.1 DUF2905 domain-containing protein [Bacillus sp. 165]
MMDFSKLFVSLGVIFLVMGLLWKVVGRLPGDILIKKGNTTFYFPIVTSIIISIILSAILYIINRLK